MEQKQLLHLTHPLKRATQSLMAFGAYLTGMIDASNSELRENGSFFIQAPVLGVIDMIEDEVRSILDDWPDMTAEDLEMTQEEFKDYTPYKAIIERTEDSLLIVDPEDAKRLLYALDVPPHSAWDFVKK